MSKSKETTIFLHIPKTAGTSFLSILKRNFDTNKTFTINGLTPYSSLSKFASLSQEERNNLDLIQGHRTLGLHNQIENPCTYITFLREPISHFLSDYFYIKRNSIHGFHKIVSEMKSFEEYLKFIEDTNNDNVQTRHLSGSSSHMERNSIDFKIEGEKFYSIAKDNLDKLIPFVFIMEKFNEALLILKNKYRIKNIKYKIQNRTENKTPISSFQNHIIEKIEYLCRYDILLYEQAKLKHEKLKQDLNIDWTSELKKIDRDNYFYSKLLIWERIKKGIENKF